MTRVLTHVVIAGLLAGSAGTHESQPLELLSSHVDKVDGITWYYRQPVSGGGTFVRFYFGVRNGQVLPLRLKAQFTGHDWIFAETLKVRTEKQVVETDRLDWNRDNGSDVVWEWADFIPTPEFVQALVGTKEATVRFKGKYVHDLQLRDSDIQELREVLLVWRAAHDPVDQEAQASLHRMSEETAEKRAAAKAVAAKAREQAEEKQAREDQTKAEETAKLKVRRDRFLACLAGDTSQEPGVVLATRSRCRVAEYGDTCKESSPVPCKVLMYGESWLSATAEYEDRTLEEQLRDAGVQGD